MDVFTGILAGVIAVLLIVLLPIKSHMRLLLSVSAMVVSTMGLGGIYSNGSRVVAFGLAVSAVCWKFLKRRSSAGVDEKSSRILATGFIFIYILFLMLQIYAFLPASHPRYDVLLDMLAVVLGIGIVLSFIYTCESDLLMRVPFIFAVPLVVSIILGIVSPEANLVQQRLNGLFGNANTVGFISFLLLASVVLLKNRPRFWLMYVAVGVVGLAWSASRASAAATAVVLLFALVLGMDKKLRTYAYAGITVIVVPLAVIFRDTILGSLLFRDTASRTTWDWAFNVISQNPTQGVGKIRITQGSGYRELEAYIASSPITAGVWVGYKGIVIVGLICLAMLIMAVMIDRRLFGLALGLSGHSLLESWLVAPGSGLTLLAFVVFIMAARHFQRVSISQRSITVE